MSAPDGGVEAVLARLQATSEELDRMAVAQQAEWDQARAGWAEEDEERARLARRGDLGPQWQRLQARIDLGETSVSAVLRGADDSADAAVVMTDARRKAAELGAALREGEQDDEVPVLRAERAEMAELSALLDELRAMTGGSGDSGGPAAPGSPTV